MIEGRLLLFLDPVMKQPVTGWAKAHNIGIDIDAVVKIILGLHRYQMMPFHVLGPGTSGSECRVGGITEASVLFCHQDLTYQDVVAVRHLSGSLYPLWGNRNLAVQQAERIRYPLEVFSFDELHVVVKASGIHVLASLIKLHELCILHKGSFKLFQCSIGVNLVE